MNKVLNLVKKMLSLNTINYDEPVFRPPREADSLIIQATIGCSRNTCAFCVMYKHKKFRVRALNEICSEIKTLPPGIKNDTLKIFLADGNAFCAETEFLLGLCSYLRGQFPALRVISAYANPYDILEKSSDELTALRNAGIKNLYIGLESGSDKVLALVRKKGNYLDYRAALQKADNAGFSLSVTILLGVGGRTLSAEHAQKSAGLINETAPKFVNTLTTTLYEGAAINELLKKGDFELLTNGELFSEHYNFIENISADKIIYRSNHISNVFNIEGVLQKDKQRILDGIKQFSACNRGILNKKYYQKLEL
ncbi:MAG: radical SAM protein [Candidatus Wallbacteria bacterium]